MFLYLEYVVYHVCSKFLFNAIKQAIYVCVCVCVCVTSPISGIEQQSHVNKKT
jgi:hypothetical protein